MILQKPRPRHVYWQRNGLATHQYLSVILTGFLEVAWRVWPPLGPDIKLISLIFMFGPMSLSEALSSQYHSFFLSGCHIVWANIHVN